MNKEKQIMKILKFKHNNKEREERRQRVARNKIENNQINLRDWPYCSIGIVKFKYNGEEKFETGSLIGPYEVLTVAHNVFNDFQQHMTEINFLIGCDEETFENKVEVDKIYIPDDYMKDPRNSNEDYAGLRLKESLDEYRYFGVYFIPFEELQNKYL